MMTYSEYIKFECPNPHCECNEACPHYVECMVASHDYPQCDTCPHRLTCHDEERFYGCHYWEESMGEDL